MRETVHFQNICYSPFHLNDTIKQTLGKQVPDMDIIEQEIKEHNNMENVVVVDKKKRRQQQQQKSLFVVPYFTKRQGKHILNEIRKIALKKQEQEQEVEDKDFYTKLSNHTISLLKNPNHKFKQIEITLGEFCLAYILWSRPIGNISGNYEKDHWNPLIIG
jgi:hypothetical protein